MYIYNITTKVDPSIHEIWVEWMKKTHIPAIMKTGCFTESQFAKLLELDDTDGPTYALQFRIAAKADYNRYLELHANNLRNEVFAVWGNKVIAFRSLMQVVH